MKPDFNKYRPSTEVVRLYRAVIEAIEETNRIRPVVEGYQKRILAQNRWHNLHELDMCGDEGVECERRVILDPNHIYLMDENDAGEYFDLCHQAALDLGLETGSPQVCPLLVAERKEYTAKKELLALFLAETKEFLGVTVDQVARAGVGFYDKMVGVVLSAVEVYEASHDMTEIESLAKRIVETDKE